MFDYKLIEALGKVIQEGGFERAAKALFLTQSAVSQRVRQLEDQCGQLLLTRSSPPQPTAAGKALLKHFQQVSLLEEGLKQDLMAADEDDTLPTIAIGINADSLAFWFMDALEPVFARMNVLVDLRVDDQEQTHNYLRDGDVVGCISNEPKAMQGCRVELLGKMQYRLLVTPDFAQRWFPQGLTAESVQKAPAVLFNRKDRLHVQFLETHLGLQRPSFPSHYLPSPDPFAQLITKGFSYGMIPDWQGRALLANGELIELIPGATVTVELFWHCWNLTAAPLDALSQQLVSGAKACLNNN